jgi:hypothetical protein
MVARLRGEPGPPRRQNGAGAAPVPWGLDAELSGVMAAAGNRAVGRLVRSLQRVDYTKTQANVAGTGITRLEVHDLKYGVDGFESKYGEDRRAGGPALSWLGLSKG